MSGRHDPGANFPPFRIPKDPSNNKVSPSMNNMLQNTRDPARMLTSSSSPRSKLHLAESLSGRDMVARPMRVSIAFASWERLMIFSAPFLVTLRQTLTHIRTYTQAEWIGGRLAVRVAWVLRYHNYQRSLQSLLDLQHTLHTLSSSCQISSERLPTPLAQWCDPNLRRCRVFIDLVIASTLYKRRHPTQSREVHIRHRGPIPIATVSQIKNIPLSPPQIINNRLRQFPQVILRSTNLILNLHIPIRIVLKDQRRRLFRREEIPEGMQMPEPTARRPGEVPALILVAAMERLLLLVRPVRLLQECDRKSRAFGCGFEALGAPVVEAGGHDEDFIEAQSGMLGSCWGALIGRYSYHLKDPNATKASPAMMDCREAKLSHVQSLDDDYSDLCAACSSLIPEPITIMVTLVRYPPCRMLKLLPAV
ncbi:hypothetical protein KC351_g4 [Hortaea werneckii]|nr:hypothetical protein KC351_g4 [Hortaea werneckii]